MVKIKDKKLKIKRKDSEGPPLMFLGGIHEHGTYEWERFAATWLMTVRRMSMNV